MKKNIYKLLSITVVFILVLSNFGTASAAPMATIDFSGLAEGTIVSSVSSGAGISGDVISGSVAVYGYNPVFPATNTAMIFDATCAGGCSGGDNDLMWPELGNILIISEDLDTGDPDDADVSNSYFTFDFAGFGTGKVNVDSLVVGDIESIETGGTIKIYSDGTLLASKPIPVTGDHAYATVNIKIANVDFIKVAMKGSGAVDNIKLTVDETPGEDGCTPGYWKNHPTRWAVTGYATTMTVEDVFDVPDAFGLDSDTLMKALSYKGGSDTVAAARILLRSAVAAVLNAAHPKVDYPLTSAEIIAAVNEALLGKRGDMLHLKDKLDMYNNYGCPLN